MKQLIVVTSSMLLIAPLSYADDHTPTTQSSNTLSGLTVSLPQLSVSMFLENYGGPFVTRNFAARLSQIVIEEKYPTNVLSFDEVADVADIEGMWVVTVNIHIPAESPIASLGGKELKQLKIQIRKTNAEIVSIS